MRDRGFQKVYFKYTILARVTKNLIIFYNLISQHNWANLIEHLLKISNSLDLGGCGEDYFLICLCCIEKAAILG